MSVARCRLLSLFVGLVVVLAACSDDGGSAYDFSEISATVADFVEAEGLNGAGLVVVHREEGVIHHEHWGEFGEDRVSLIASSSKMITAGVLLRLHDDGLLDIDAPIADVVEWGAANPDVTTAQLISNSSGLVGLLPNPSYVPYGCQFDEAWDLQTCAERIFTTPDDDADIVPPDVEFRYGGAQWQVAGAVAEIASGKTWAEPGAQRAIFYLGDEALEGGDPRNAGDVAAADAAITVANAASVTVFTYAGTNIQAASSAEYARVATSTGGQAFGHPIGNVGGIAAVLEKIICAAGGEGCSEAPLPDVKPCFHLRWGDGPNDQIETDDFEVLCITACNPYANVTIKDLTVVLTAIVKDDGSTVPPLPDGTRSVEITPDRMICFGDIAPCDPKKPNESSCVSREVVLSARGAEPGGYRWRIGSCYSVDFALHVVDDFKIELVRS